MKTSDVVHPRLRAEGQEDHQQAGDQSQDFKQRKNHGKNFYSFYNVHIILLVSYKVPVQKLSCVRK